MCMEANKTTHYKRSPWTAAFQIAFIVIRMSLEYKKAYKAVSFVKLEGDLDMECKREKLIAALDGAFGYYVTENMNIIFDNVIVEGNVNAFCIIRSL